MENISQFDLNASLGHWLERLAQSPHFRKENVAEMESHVRDSVTNLRSQGLSEEESFLIAIRRAGSVGKLEPEYAKVNWNWLNLIAHGLILLFFSIGCYFLWGLLHYPELAARSTGGGNLPQFTQWLVDLRPWLCIPPLLAAAYCSFIWIQKSNSKGRNSWMGFFASVMAVLFLLTLPILYAVFLPLIAILANQFLAK